MATKKDTIVIALITIFTVTPAVLALIAYMITKNPSLRPLGITVERLTEAGQIENKSIIIAVVDIGGEAKNASSPHQYQSAIETTFARLDMDVQVKFRTIPRSEQVNITYLVGESRIGPYPAERAAEGVIATVQAARMVVTQRKAVAKELERKAKLGQDGFWYRVLN